MSSLTGPKPAGTVTWIDMAAPDVDAARAFYQAVFGWEYDIGGPEYGGYSTARLGQRAVAGMSGPPPGAPPMPAAWGLYFASDDIESDVARAVALGATLVAPPMVVGEFGSMAVCADPTGATFSFWQAGQHVGFGVVDAPGATTWYELYSGDAARARDFYSALFDASAEQMSGDLEYYILKHGDTTLGGIMQIDPAWGGFAPQWMIYFTITSADDTLATIVAHGGAVMGGIDDTPFGRMAAVRDPQGATFKIVEPPQR